MLGNLLPTTSVTLLNQGLVLDLEVLDFVVPFCQLDSDLVSLVFCGFELRQKNVLMHLNLLLAFLHRHLKLVLLVLQRVHVVCGPGQGLLDLLNL